MRQGYYGDAIQALDAPVTGEKNVVQAEQTSSRAYADNRDRILLAQSDDPAVAERAMAELIEANGGLIRTIAMRFRERGVEFEDLVQIGTIGMIKAIRNFDTERGTCFSTYAVPLIFGEIRRHLRDEGPIKVGRYYKKLGAALLTAKNRIMAEEGREAHIGELAEICGVSAEEAAMALDATSPVLSLSSAAFSEDDGIELEETLMDREASEEIPRLCERIALGQALKKMPETWQKIVMLRYFRNLTQQQTAERLGVTQVKISREEKKIMAFLRAELAN